MPTPLCYGMSIRLRHNETGAFLGSVLCNYQHENSSCQQIVGGTAKRDQNSIWLIKPPHAQHAENWDGQPLLHGRVLRLEHVATHRNLHSHDHPAPLTGPQQREVTAYSHQGAGIGDANDDWSLELAAGGQWQTGQQFRLRHVGTNRLLHSHGLAHHQSTAGLYEVTALDQGDLNDLYVCVEADQPAAEHALVVAGEHEKDGTDYGPWLVRQFRCHPVKIIVYSVALIAGTWVVLNETLLRTTEQRLIAAQEDRDRFSSRLKEASDELVGLRKQNVAQKNALPKEPRTAVRLTEVQVASLARDLRGASTASLGVAYNWGDAAADGLANDLKRAFEKAGFKIWTGFYEEYMNDTGLWLEIPTADYRPDLVKKIQAACGGVGLNLTIKINEKVQKEGSEMEIRIIN